MTDSFRDALQTALGPNFSIERELGGGGMSRVFVVRDSSLNRRIVAKVLSVDIGGAISAERFRREIAVAAGLQHPNIVPLLTAGEAGGLPYYTMPFVEGESLRDLIERNQVSRELMPVADAVTLVREIADALLHAHTRGIVHRDLKPANVLLSDGHATVTDFGIAKALTSAIVASDNRPVSSALTSVGVALGTPAYMAPEQAVADPSADYRVDLYALGVVAYELLTGAPPFVASSSHAVVAAHLTETPASLHERRKDIPPAIAQLVMSLLAKSPDDRPQSAKEVIDRISETMGSGSNNGIKERRSNGARFTSAVFALVAAVAVVAGVWWIRQNSSATTAASNAPGAKSQSVAVMPFSNDSNDPANQPFSDGLTDELIGAFGKVPGLKVTGRTSTFALRNKGLNASELGTKLGVSNLVEGSVAHDGSRVRITVRLIDAQSDSVIWNDTYNKELKDVFALQEDIAQKVVDALKIQLTPSSKPHVRTATTSPEAHEMYNKGRSAFNTQFGKQGILQAVDFFTQATRLDSNYANAYSGLADAYIRMGVYGFMPSNEAFNRALAGARRALEIDSTLGEAHGSLAHALCASEFAWDAAEREYRKAIALDPGFTFVRVPFAICLAGQGRFDEAIANLDTARTLDPLAPTISNMMGRVYLSANKPSEAIHVLQQTLALNPRMDVAFQTLGHAYLLKGQNDSAIKAFKRGAELNGARDSAQLAYAYATTGQRNEAQKIMNNLLAPARLKDALPFHIAMGLAGLGDKDGAFKWLDEGFNERSSFMVGTKIEPAFVSLHSDPRWAALMKRMGLKP